VILRWHIEHGISAIPKSVTAHRIAESFDVFDVTHGALVLLRWSTGEHLGYRP
jgi:diketogulonate reductase-like aldo/keto reductase